MVTYRILIVDDQREVRRMLRAGLETLKANLKIVDVPSAEEATLVLSGQRFDLLVSDVRLPGISGLEMVRRARLQNPAIKLVLFTGATDHRTRQQVSEANVDAYFYKPLDVNEFLAFVNQCLAEAADQPEPPPAEPPAARPARARAEPEARLKEAAPPVVTPPPPPAAPAPPRRPPQPAPQAGAIQYRASDERQMRNAQKPRPTLGDRLADLRQSGEAMAVLLVDNRGQLMAQAGSLPGFGGNEPLLFAALLEMWGASTKAAHLLGTTEASGWICLNGKAFDLISTPVDAGTLLVTAGAGLAGARLAQVAELALACAGEIRAMFVQLGVTPLPPPEAPPTVSLEAILETTRADSADAPLEAALDAELAALFEGGAPSRANSLALDGEPGLAAGSDGAAAARPPQQLDVDAFWDSLVDAPGERDLSSPDALSYDQARQLGLAPEGSSASASSA